MDLGKPKKPALDADRKRSTTVPARSLDCDGRTTEGSA